MTQITAKRWKVATSSWEGEGEQEFVAAMCWVTDSGALMIGNHVDGEWIPDVVFNSDEWSSVHRIETG